MSTKINLLSYFHLCSCDKISWIKQLRKLCIEIIIEVVVHHCGESRSELQAASHIWIKTEEKERRCAYSSVLSTLLHSGNPNPVGCFPISCWVFPHQLRQSRQSLTNMTCTQAHSDLHNPSLRLSSLVIQGGVKLPVKANCQYHNITVFLIRFHAGSNWLCLSVMSRAWHQGL